MRLVVLAFAGKHVALALQEGRLAQEGGLAQEVAHQRHVIKGDCK
jgi:hypothetical protein